MGLLKDVHPTIAEILEGKHDSILHSFAHAVEARKKAARSELGLRVRAEVIVTGGKVEGREGVIVRINPKTVTVDLACLECGSHDEVPEATPWDERCEACSGLPESWNVTPNVLTVKAPVTA